MPVVSKYTNAQIESLLHELEAVLIRAQAPVELSLLALGNLTTHLISQQIPPAQQARIADSFAQALKQSLQSPPSRH